MSKRKPKAKKETAAEKKAIVVREVVNQAAEQAFEFFHSSDDTCYVTMPVNGHRETWKLRNQRLIVWIKRALYLALGLSGNSGSIRCTFWNLPHFPRPGY